MGNPNIMDKCEYCGSPVGNDAARRCPQCGGQVAIKQRDYTSCPSCKRKLLALASTACNYCGKGLPQDYIQARQAVAQTIAEQSKRGPSEEVIFKDESGISNWLGTINDIMKRLEQ